MTLATAACTLWQPRMTPSNPQRRKFRPTLPPEPARISISLDELHGMLERFKAMFEESKLAKYIKWAGWGALATVGLELVRIIWLAYRHLRGV